MRILHIIDRETPEDAQRQLNLLLNRLPADRVRNALAFIGPPPELVTPPPNIPILRQGHRLPGPMVTGRELRRKLKGRSFDLVHAWGSSAAEVSEIAFADHQATLTTLTDPAEVPHFQRTWKRLEVKKGVGNLLVPSRSMQGQLVRANIPRQAITVLPPMVNIEALQEARRSVQRSDLGLSGDCKVILTPSPPSRQTGHFYTFWASAVVQVLREDVQVIIPGRSREQRRLRRLQDNTLDSDMFLFPEYRYTPEQLLAVADLFVLPAIENVPVGWLVRALAAGVPILASRVPAIEEFIVHEQTGILCPPGNAHLLTIDIRNALDDLQTAQQRADAAASKAQRNFNPDHLIPRYLELLEARLASCSATNIR